MFFWKKKIRANLKLPMKDIAVRLEIHLYSDEEAAILITSNCWGREKRFGEILLYCGFSIRQLMNLGKGNKFAFMLADFLSEIGPDTVDRLLHKTYPGVLMPDLIYYKGYKGRKGFVATVNYSETKSVYKFNCQSWGFGFLARGMSNQTLYAVILLLKYLAAKNKMDSEFNTALSRASLNCYNAFYGSLSLENQNITALKTAQAAFSHYPS
jgi:hypothetical protein